MLEVEYERLSVEHARRKDDILREAVNASRDSEGEPDAYFIIDYLVERLLTLNPGFDGLSILQPKN